MKILFVHRHPNKTNSQKRYIKSTVQTIEDTIASHVGQNSFEIELCDHKQIKDYIFDAENPSGFSTHNKKVSLKYNELGEAFRND